MLEKITDAFSNIARRLSGKAAISEKNISDTVEEIKTSLLDADVNIRVVRRFVNSTISEALGEKVLKAVNPGQQFTKIIYDKLVNILGGEEDASLKLNSTNTVTTILMAGLQGSGKTTSSAKLALKLKKDGRRVLLAACDTVRPAAITQLKILGESIGVPVFSEDKTNSVNNAVLAKKEALSKQYDTLIVDTAGRLQVDDLMMQEIASIKEKLEPDNILLVCDAMTGQIAAEVAKVFNEKLEITGVIFTKFDSDTRGGAVLSLKTVTQKPILFVGTGEKIEDFEAFHAARIASRILGMGDIVSLVEKAQEEVDEKEALALQAKMARNEWTLEDMLLQFRQIKKMGSMQSLVDLIPGMAGQSVDEKQVKRQEAIILSMTKKERQNYLILGPSRRRRIASGSGCSINEVNRLIKQFEKTRLMMKKVTRSKGMQQAFLQRLGGGDLSKLGALMG